MGGGEIPEEWRTELIVPDGKGRCSRPWKIPRYLVAESCSEGVREDSGWKDKDDNGG